MYPTCLLLCKLIPLSPGVEINLENITSPFAKVNPATVVDDCPLAVNGVVETADVKTVENICLYIIA